MSNDETEETSYKYAQEAYEKAQRVETLVVELMEDISEGSYWYLDARYVLDKLAMSILKQTRDDVKLVTNVRWHEGCHCHGNDCKSELHDPTIEGIARKLANHAHADDDDVYATNWVIRPSEEERDLLSDTYKKFTIDTEKLAFLEKTYIETYGILKSKQEHYIFLTKKFEEIVRDLNDEAKSRWREDIEAAFSEIEKAIEIANKSSLALTEFKKTRI